MEIEAQILPDDVADRGVVVQQQQNGFVHEEISEGLRGRVKTKRAPWGWTRSCQISPPYASTVRLMNAKPIPVPPLSSRVLRQGWKRSSSMLGGTPGPL